MCVFVRSSPQPGSSTSTCMQAVSWQGSWSAHHPETAPPRENRSWLSRKIMVMCELAQVGASLGGNGFRGFPGFPGGDFCLKEEEEATEKNDNGICVMEEGSRRKCDKVWPPRDRIMDYIDNRAVR